MLEEILAYVHNYFEGEVEHGEFDIVAGRLEGCTLNLLEGQKIRIQGSVFSDGVWEWHQAALKDSDGNTVQLRPSEHFKGTVTALKVPASVQEMSKTIAEWRGKYEAIMMSPYSSESFGGYQYQRASSAVGGSKGTQLWQTWQDVFAKQLNKWRKIG